MADFLRHRFRPGRLTRDDVAALHALRDMLLSPERVTTSYPLVIANDSDGKTWLGCDIAAIAAVLNENGNEIVTNTLTINVNDQTVSTTVNDFGTGGSSKLRVNASSSSSKITGFAAGRSGQLLVVWNVGSHGLVLADQNGGSMAANQILCPLAADYTLWPKDGVILEYDGISNRWRFDVPTVGAGDGTALKTYAIRQLKFRTNLTYTDNNDGSAFIDAAGGGFGAGESGAVPLASDYTLTSSMSNVTSGAGDVAVTLPTASGIYILQAMVTASFPTTSPPTSAPGSVQAELFDDTAAATISNTTAMVCNLFAGGAPGANQFFTQQSVNTSAITRRFTTSVPNQVVRLRAKYTGSSPNVPAINSGSANGSTSLTFWRVA